MWPFHVNYPVHDGYSVLTTPGRVGVTSTCSGRGVVIAFIDSGFYPHPDLADRVVVHVDATSNRVIESDRNFKLPEWFSWHGQMTSVIAAGAGKTFPGVAPGARLVLIKVSNRRGRIKEEDILRGFRWVCENHARYNIRVVNVSVGGDFESADPAHPLHRCVQRLAAEGITVCVAAGNRLRAFVLPPASAPASITVGGVDDHNSMNPHEWLLYLSSYGYAYDRTPKPEVIAPARWIASPILPGTPEARKAHWLARLLDCKDEGEVRAILREGYTDLEIAPLRARVPDAHLYRELQYQIEKHKIIDGEHQHVDGTSVAVAIVTGIVALLLEARPSLSPGEIRALLTGTADLLPGIPRERQGGGLVNVSRALAYLGELANVP